MSIYLVIIFYVFSVPPTSSYPVPQTSPVSVAPDTSSAWNVSVSALFDYSWVSCQLGFSVNFTSSSPICCSPKKESAWLFTSHSMYHWLLANKFSSQLGWLGGWLSMSSLCFPAETQTLREALLSLPSSLPLSVFTDSFIYFHFKFLSICLHICMYATCL